MGGEVGGEDVHKNLLSNREFMAIDAMKHILYLEA